jgi:hypothetical protein
MKKNMSSADRIIRIVVAIALSALNLTHVTGGFLAIIFWVAAVILVLTSVFGTCLIYLLFNMSTKKEARKA